MIFSFWYPKQHMFPITRIVLFILIFKSCVLALTLNGTIRIKIGLLYGTSDMDNSRIDRINAVFLRVQQLNQISSLIHPNATIDLVFRDHLLSRSKTIQQSLELRDEGVIGVIGAGLSRLSILMSFILQQYQIPQCCGSSTSPALADKTQYPNLLSAIPNDNQQAVAMANYAVSQGWKKIAVVHTDEDYGNGLADKITQVARTVGLQIAIRTPLQLGLSKSAATESLNTIKETGAKVVIYFGFPAELKIVLSAAKTLGMYGDGYVWLASEANKIISVLFPTEMKLFTGMLVFYPTEGQGELYDQFLQNWKTNRLKTGYEFANKTNEEPSPFSTFSASCVDLLLYGFDRLVKSNSTFNVTLLRNRTLNQYMKIPQMFSLTDTPTGKVILDENGVREGDYNIYNVDNEGGFPLVAKYSKIDGITFSKSIVYPGGTLKKPLGGVDPVEVAEYFQADSSTGSLSIALFVIGMILNLAVLGMSFVHKKHKVIKKSKLKLNLLVLLSFMLPFLQLLVIVVKPRKLSCVSNTLLIPVGFALAHGLLFSKGYQIYRSYYSYTADEKSSISEWKMIAHGSLWVVPVLIIVFAWNLIDSPSPITVRYGIDKYYWSCASQSNSFQSSMETLLIAYLSILIIANLILCFKSSFKSFKVRELQLIALAIYNISAISIFTLLVMYSPSISFRIKGLILSVAIGYSLFFNIGALFGYNFYRIISNPSSKMNWSASMIKDLDKPKSVDIILQKADHQKEVPVKTWKYISKVWVRRNGILSRLFPNDQVKFMALSAEGSMIVFFDFIPNADDAVSFPAVASIGWSSLMIQKLQVEKRGSLALIVKIDGVEYLIKFISEKAMITWYDWLSNWKKIKGFTSLRNLNSSAINGGMISEWNNSKSMLADK